MKGFNWPSVFGEKDIFNGGRRRRVDRQMPEGTYTMSLHGELQGSGELKYQRQTCADIKVILPCM